MKTEWSSGWYLSNTKAITTNQGQYGITTSITMAAIHYGGQNGQISISRDTSGSAGLWDSAQRCGNSRELKSPVLQNKRSYLDQWVRILWLWKESKRVSKHNLKLSWVSSYMTGKRHYAVGQSDVVHPHGKGYKKKVSRAGKALKRSPWQGHSGTTSNKVSGVTILSFLSVNLLNQFYNKRKLNYF